MPGPFNWLRRVPREGFDVVTYEEAVKPQADRSDLPDLLEAGVALTDAVRAPRGRVWEGIDVNPG